MNTPSRKITDPADFIQDGLPVSLTVDQLDDYSQCGFDEDVVQALEAGDYATARRLLQDVHQENPGDGVALITLGECCLKLGEYETAEELLAKACAIKQDNANVWKNLGVALMEQRRPEEALTPLERAYRLNRKLPGLRAISVSALEMCGRYHAVAQLFKEQLDEMVEPTQEDYGDLARMYQYAGKQEQAEEYYEKCLDMGFSVKYANSYALMLHGSGRDSQALEWLNKAIEQVPDDIDLRTNRVSTLLSLGRLSEGLDDLAERAKDYKPMVHRASNSSYLFFEHYRDQLSRKHLYELASEWGRRHVPLTRIQREFRNMPEPDRTLKIGYVSPDFRMHSVNYFFESVLDGQGDENVENYLYSCVANEDKVTAVLQQKGHRFRRIREMGVEEAVAQIAADGIDILVDLAGHTSGNRQDIFARKAAPIQVTWLGYPDTTGNPAIDYRITDALADPPETEAFHSEELAYMPDSFLCYRPPSHAPTVGPLPMLKNGYVTFGSFNNQMKIHRLTRGLWASVLQAVPESRLLLKNRGGRDDAAAEAIYADFESLGIERDRVDIRPLVGNPQAHLATYNEVDLALDAYPYNGTTTTCESLWMGVPVLSLFGEVHSSRVGLSLLSNIDLEFFATSSPEEFVHRAVAIADNAEALETLRQTMRQRMAASPVCNAPQFARHLALLYRTMWHRWCERQGVDTTEAGATRPTQQAMPDECIEVQAPRESFTEANHRENRPTLPILHNLARSGGTLVSKCIGCMDHVALLSEIHPQGTRHFNPLAQASEWFGLLTEDDIRRFRHDREKLSFQDAIALIRDRAAENDLHLILRDWAHLDFIAVPFLPIPSNRFGLVDYLAEQFDLRRLCLVRHPIDNWLSLRKLRILNGGVSIETFLRGYRHYAERAVEVGFVKYEDFVAQPATTLERMCETLGLPFDPAFQAHWNSYLKVTGDTGGTSRGSRSSEIKVLPRAAFEPELLGKARACEDYRLGLELLGYEDIEQADDAELFNVA